MMGKSGVKNVIFIYIAGLFFRVFGVGLEKATFIASGQTWP